MTDENPYITYFSPLEMLALNDLPEKARVARLASKLIGDVYVSDMTQYAAKMVIEAVGEPRGRKGWLAKMLPKEIRRQSSIRRDRERAAMRYSVYLRRALVGDYMPVGVTGDIRDYESRLRAVRLSRFNRLCGDKLPEALLEEGYPAYHLDRMTIPRTYDLSMPTPVAGGMAAVYTAAHRLRSGSRWLTESLSPDHKFLIWTDGDVIRLIRVYYRAVDVYQAVDSLKTSIVKAAEKRKDIVELDMREEQFLVRNPKRKKWRKLPFKKHTRG